MNLKKVVKELEKVFKVWGISFGVGIKPTDSGGVKVEASANLTLKGHDDEIYAYFTFYPNGVSEYSFTFDKLEKNEETLGLVNKFNEEVLWFNAYIDDEYLQLSHLTLGISEKTVAAYTHAVLDNLANDEDVAKHLTPLTKLTVE